MTELPSNNLSLNRQAITYGLKAYFSQEHSKQLALNLIDYQRAYESELEIAGSDLPEITWAIIAKDAEKSLPLYFQSLLLQSYPKSKINLFVRTNDNSDSTSENLSWFIANFREFFASIHFDDSSIDKGLKKFELHEWNTTRFGIMARIRQESINFARNSGSKFYFCSDVDNFLVPETLKNLVSLDLQAVAPLLRCTIPVDWEPTQYENNRYSNFHDAVNEDYWFKKTDRYIQILKEETRGVFDVPLIHCTYLVRRDVFDQVNYAEIPGNWEYKNFSISLSKNDIPQFIDARKTYGYVTMSNDVAGCERDLTKLIEMNERNQIDNLAPERTIEMQDNKGIFDDIYVSKKWGFQSGSGSDPVNAKVWINLVNRILEMPEFTSILDIGCGDWRLGSQYNLASKNYLGLEVSEEALRICSEFSDANVRFVQGDAELIEFPKVDLILIKDVLQHLNSKSIAEIFSKIQQSCKVALICNDFDSKNSDISNGGYRGLDLRKEPFLFDLPILEVFGDRNKVIYAFINREALSVEAINKVLKAGSSRVAGNKYSQ